MTTKMSAAAEIEKLRKRLMESKNEISELREELKQQEILRYKITEVCFFHPVLKFFIGA